MTLSPAQQAVRAKGIGSSEIAAVCGLSPWRGPFDVWAEKMGLTEPFQGNAATRWGTRLEDDIADAYAEAHYGVTIETCDTVVKPGVEWMVDTPDRIVRAGAKWWLLECKNPGHRRLHLWGEEYTDEIPTEHLPQVIWHMSVNECARCDVAAYFGGDLFREYTVMRAKYGELEAALIEEGRRFWFEHVLTGNPPQLDGTAATLRYLQQKYPDHSGDWRASTPDAETAAAALRELRGKRSSLARSIAAEENRLKALIGDAVGVETTLGRIAWKKAKNGTRRFSVPREWGGEEK